MIEDVLLTPEEIEKAHEGKEAADAYEWDLDIAKAAQLKLLKWLNGQCTEHSDRKSNNGQCRRMDCPQCDAELRKQLEGK